MKKIHFLLFGFLLAGFAFMTSCTDDSNDPVVDQKPMLTFQVGTGYTSGNTSVPVNTVLKFGVRAASNSNSGSKLTQFSIARTFNGSTITYDTTLSSLSTYNVDYEMPANDAAGNETFVFTLRDKAGQVNTLTVTVTTTPVSGPINAFTMKILGAQGSSTGSSFASIDGTVYTMAQAEANSQKVDLVYYYGATDLATLAAPADDHAQSVFNGANPISGWNFKNATLFKTVTDAVDFDAITDDAIIVAQCASGVDLSRIIDLSPGKLLAFITVTGKKGILKVESISGTQTGTITISVKVQQ